MQARSRRVGRARESGPDTDVVGLRAVAQVVDVVVIWLLLVGFAVVLGAGVGPSRPVVLGLLLTGFGYNALLEAYWGGQTVGKRLTGVEVRSHDGSEASPGQAVLRNLPAILWPALLAYFVAVLAIAIDDRNRRLFDQLAGTIVVRSA